MTQTLSAKGLDPLGSERAMAEFWEANKRRGMADHAGQAPAPHSLLHRLAGAVHKEEGRPLTDTEITVQARTFMVAGAQQLTRPSRPRGVVMNWSIMLPSWKPSERICRILRL